MRTALYNYLFAKQNNGTLILRIEDTDSNRFVEGAEQYIYDSFDWLGINFDESPFIGGSYGPYKQSERKELYKAYAEKLISSGHAYYAFDSESDLESRRAQAKALKSTFSYNAITREGLKNSLILPADDVKKRIESGEPYVIRFKNPRRQEVRFTDIVRGNLVFETDTLDDKILLKSDGMATYHLANVVDDHLMEISHVIRAEEWLPSAPLHVMLYKAFGWEAPEFAHLPLLLAPAEEGSNKKEKLSKRHGDKYGFPIFALNWEYKKPDTETLEKITGYKDSGYIKEAVLNFLLLQGWHPSDDKEFFTLEEAIKAFELKAVSKAGISFDYKKLKWFNGRYLHNIPDEELVEFFIADLKEKKNIDCTREKALQIIPMAKERSEFKSDLISNVDFFFKAPKTFNKDLYVPELAEVMFDFTTRIVSMLEFSGEQAKHILLDIIKEKGLKNGKILKPFRDAITGVESGPELHNIFSVLGRSEILSRMKNYLTYMEYKFEEKQ